jgi:hypothetical protein
MFVIFVCQGQKHSGLLRALANTAIKSLSLGPELQNFFTAIIKYMALKARVLVTSFASGGWTQTLYLRMVRQLLCHYAIAPGQETVTHQPQSLNVIFVTSLRVVFCKYRCKIPIERKKTQIPGLVFT